MKTRLIDFFRGYAPDRDSEELASEVLGIVEHRKKADAAKNRENEAIDKALRKISQAITALEKVDGHRVKHLLNNLYHVKYEAGTPREKNELKSSYIHRPGPDYALKTISSELKPWAKNARLLIDLERLWFRTFGERPSEYRDHKFFELAEIVCPGPNAGEAKAESLYRQRQRVAKPLPHDED